MPKPDPAMTPPRYAAGEPATAACRCYACGTDDPMGCGQLCPDCSFEEATAGWTYQGPPFEPPREDTPACCLRSYAIAGEVLDA